MDWWTVLLLAVVQGVTEFLPISSSGHLLVLEHLLGPEFVQAAPVVNVFLHLGTLLAIVWMFRAEVVQVCRSRRLVGLLVWGTVPGLAAGGVVRVAFPELLQHPGVAAGMFWLSAGLILWMSRHRPGQCDLQALGPWGAWWVGCAQAAALLPGLSRSGATIAAALALGLRRSAAASWSFLLAVPIILAAATWEGIRIFWHSNPWHQASPTPPPVRLIFVLALGVAVAFLTGLISLRCLLRWLNQGTLDPLAWWCVVLGGVCVVLAWG